MQILKSYHNAMDWIASFAPGDASRFTHTYVGLGIWLGAAILLRRPLTSARPLLVVAGLELANEVMDWLYAHGWTWEDTKGDVLSTLFWPVVLALALKMMPWLGGKRR